MHSLHIEKSVQISATDVGLVPPLVTTDKARQSSPSSAANSSPVHCSLSSRFAIALHEHERA